MNEPILRESIADLTEGQRQFVANHMWKHYKVMPQKLTGYVPNFEFESFMQRGDVVLAKTMPNGDFHLGFVTQVDDEDLDATYRIHFGYGIEWVPKNFVKKFTPPC